MNAVLVIRQFLFCRQCDWHIRKGQKVYIRKAVFPLNRFGKLYHIQKLQ
ncbi:hypothetical protein CHCC20441_1737 [Bacillus licheniformis]|uniref:Uncharacterized protein n=1 Tax=Bacillus licheniformis TaxID=1402 RepID=A0A8B5YIP4_BACLI|nr:hypothetical protein B4092_4570 [Bacillus licheniformis]TWN11126.1 hypothetical protein CHCC14564_3678 [Bacillus licheniformis LMG 17339]KYC78089.1 hypothetical protein B4090_4257 [Bacillus licheniformis]KYC81922.1 hypothetical protein B4091_4281 [Bacillus licheniformis]KYC99551.1 hypothetical protein B4164_4000 [Bacillus licheniformis]